MLECRVLEDCEVSEWQIIRWIDSWAEFGWVLKRRGGLCAPAGVYTVEGLLFIWRGWTSSKEDVCLKGQIVNRSVTLNVSLANYLMPDSSLKRLSGRRDDWSQASFNRWVWIFKNVACVKNRIVCGWVPVGVGSCPLPSQRRGDLNQNRLKSFCFANNLTLKISGRTCKRRKLG